jgi:hypothetical protein
VSHCELLQRDWRSAAFLRRAAASGPPFRSRGYWRRHPSLSPQAPAPREPAPPITWREKRGEEFHSLLSPKTLDGPMGSIPSYPAMRAVLACAIALIRRDEAHIGDPRPRTSEQTKVALLVAVT